jgi:hypothetical protein
VGLKGLNILSGRHVEGRDTGVFRAVFNISRVGRSWYGPTAVKCEVGMLTARPRFCPKSRMKVRVFILISWLGSALQIQGEQNEKFIVNHWVWGIHPDVHTLNYNSSWVSSDAETLSICASFICCELLTGRRTLCIVSSLRRTPPLYALNLFYRTFCAVHKCRRWFPMSLWSKKFI